MSSSRANLLSIGKPGSYSIHLTSRFYLLTSTLYNCAMTSLKEHFLLDPNIVFLNHGPYGAAPRPVFEAYQNWQYRLERQPVLFLGRELPELMRASRLALGQYLNAEADDLVYIPNA